jgi:hypothetical protein
VAFAYQAPPYSCYPRIAWSASPGATFYSVYTSLSSNPATARLLGATQSLRFDDQTITELFLQHYYWVKAGNACGESALSSVVAPRVAYRPNVPDQIYAFGGCGYVDVLWSPPRVDGAGLEYTVWRSTTPQFADPLLLASHLTNTRYRDVNPPPGYFWYFVVARAGFCDGEVPLAVRGAGNMLTPPSSFIATSHECGSVELNWFDEACSSGFTVLRSPDSSIAHASVAGFTGGRGFIDHVPDRSVSLYSYWLVKHTTQGDVGPVGPLTVHPLNFGGPSLNSWDESTEFFGCSESGLELVAPLSDWEKGNVLSAQWYKDGVALTDDSRVRGSRGVGLLIRPMRPEDEGRYSVRIVTPCGEATSFAVLTHYIDCTTCSPCVPDFNSDGGVDGGDIAAFFDAWEASAFCADVNQDGGIDGADLAFFLWLWESGSC